MFLKIGIEMFEFHNLSSVGYFRLLNKKIKISKYAHNFHVD